MKRLLTITLIFIAVQLFATDIKLKNGNYITNIEIAEETDTYIVFYMGELRRRLLKDAIETIRVTPVNLSRPARVTDNFEEPTKQVVIGYYKPTFLLPVAALSLLLGINYLSDASRISDTIDSYSGFVNGEAIEDLESQLNRYRIVGIGALIASAALVYISFQSFEVYATPNKVQVSLAIN